jgi:hypothetical protein
VRISLIHSNPNLKDVFTAERMHINLDLEVLGMDVFVLVAVICSLYHAVFSTTSAYERRDNLALCFAGLLGVVVGASDAGAGSGLSSMTSGAAPAARPRSLLKAKRV